MKLYNTLFASLFSLGLCGNAVADLNDGIVAYYPFTGNANNESGTGNDGVVYGATLTEDRFGNAASAYSFNGEDDYIKIPYLSLQDNISISIWIKPNNINSCPEEHGQAILGFSPTDWSYNYWLSLCNKKVKLVVYSDSHSFIEKSDAIPSNNEWYNIIFTSKKGGDTSIYVNGIEIVTGISGNGIWNEGVITIGDLRPNRNLMFNGVIDDLHIYNRIISEPEIQELYNTDTDTGVCTGIDTNTNECIATYNADGTLNIPCVSVPNAFGGTIIYEADMAIIPLSSPLSFELIDAKIK